MKSARSTDELSLLVRLPDGSEKKIIIRRMSVFSELQYVLKCELGESVVSSPISVQFKDEVSLLSEVSWDLALLRAKDSSFLNLIVEKPTPPAANAPLKRQNSKWDTLKRGFSTLRAKDEVSKVIFFFPGLASFFVLTFVKRRRRLSKFSGVSIVEQEKQKLITCATTARLNERENNEEKKNLMLK
jgi:hypothetical protein